MATPSFNDFAFGGGGSSFELHNTGEGYVNFDAGTVLNDAVVFEYTGQGILTRLSFNYEAYVTAAKLEIDGRQVNASDVMGGLLAIGTQTAGGGSSTHTLVYYAPFAFKQSLKLTVSVNVTSSYKPAFNWNVMLGEFK